jgi:GMP synthase-like glutamine amidotransferase
MQIGILQTGDNPDKLQPFYGNYSDMFVRLIGQHDADLEFQVYRVMDNQFPESATSCDGWLITGSKYGAYDDPPWIPPLKGLIQKIKAANIPLVGICFGHQIISEALGGRVEKSEKGWGLGLDTYKLSANSPWGDQRQVSLNIFHQDQVVELPPGAEVFASSDFCQYAGLTIGDTVLTIQAHPEFSNEFNRELLDARDISTVPESLTIKAMDQLANKDAQVDSDRFGASISKFFKSSQKQE